MYECGKNICQLTYERMCTSSDQKFNAIQGRLNECKNNTELVDVMSNYIKDQYHLVLNEISFEAVNITDVSTQMEGIIINNDVYQRKIHNESKLSKSTEVNASDKKEELIVRKPEVSASKK